ncbi:MAG: hypothetical protein M3081_03750 [Gemmatimonadota bacterium]|nr:hypothetical protein [Gemmatimonadota bacterium]
MNALRAAARLTLSIALAGLAGLAACGSQQVVTSSSGATMSPSRDAALPGAASARAAVDRFLVAAKSQDIQEMALAWGTSQGPSRDQVDRSQLERRILIMQSYLSCYEKYEVTNQSTLNNLPVFEVTLTNKRITRTTKLTTVSSRDGRWFVESTELEPIGDLCHARQK